MTPRGRRVLTASAVIAVGVAFALAYGDELGTKNQLTYLLDGLARVHPELLLTGSRSRTRSASASDSAVRPRAARYRPFAW